jgi:hypothetical protein
VPTRERRGLGTRARPRTEKPPRDSDVAGDSVPNAAATVIQGDVIMLILVAEQATARILTVWYILGKIDA